MTTASGSPSQTLTAAQQRAVRTTDRSLLVSAAAGAGKTTVLAERIAHLVCDLPRADRCRVDELLVVTFTDAAAREMRTRIGAAIQKRLEQSPHDAYLREQLYLLDVASISTIHSFCRALLQRWFPQAGVDPQVEILDENDARLLAHEVLDEWFMELLAGEHALSRSFLELVDDYADGRDEALVPLVLRISRFLRSLADPAGWLKEARGRMDPRSPHGFTARLNEHQRELLGRELRLQEEYAGHAAELIQRCWPVARMHAETASAIAQALSSWRQRLCAEKGEPWETIAEEVRAFEPPSRRRPNKLSEDDKAAYDAALGSVNQVKKYFKDRLAGVLCRFTSQDHREGLERVAGPMDALLSVVEEFGRRYQAAKSRRAVADFEDLQRYAFELLTERDRPDRPSEVARVLQAQYRHVLVDEFQDIDPLQYAILRMVSRESATPPQGNLFAVGDIKQSIYRFRLAEPQLFAERERAFAASGAADPFSRGPEARADLRSAAKQRDAGGTQEQISASSIGQVIHLQENFRSRREVIGAINAMFRQLMRESFGGTDYDARTELRAEARYPDRAPGAVFGPPGLELHLLERVGSETETHESQEEAAVEDTEDDELEEIEREGFLIGQRIRAWFGGDDRTARWQVADRPPVAGQPAVMRPIEYRDIVILLRSLAHKAEPIAETLRRMGIPVRIESDAAQVDSTEFRDVVSLLRVLDNQQRDLPLAAVLRSPMLPERLTESDLLRIRLSAPDAPFHAAVDRYAQVGGDAALRQRVGLALARLERYRRRMARVPIAQVLWEIYEETRYLAFVSGLPGGLQRRDHLLRVHELARSFGRFSRQGLRRFLRFLDEILEEDRPLRGVGASSTGDQNAVRIMTIHASKGLEFPVVVLADLSRKFNLGDLHGSILLDRELGLAPRAVDAERRLRYPTLAHQLAVERGRHENLSEELRVFYVALTRAREHLLLVGRASAKNIAAWRQISAIGGVGHVPPQLALGTGGSFLDWVAAAVVSMPTDGVHWHEGTAAAMGGWPIEVRVHDRTATGQWRLPPPVDTERVEPLRRLAELEPLPTEEPIDEGEAVGDVILALGHEYPALELTTVPARASVADLKRRWDAVVDPSERLSTPAWRSRWQTQPEFVQTAASVSPAERGSLLHRFLQQVDLGRPCDLPDLRAQWASLGMSDIAAGSPDGPESAAWFFAGELGQRLRRNRERVRRELAFVSRLTPDRIVPDVRPRDDRDVVLVRGIADAVLIDDDALEIVDYKTDRVEADRLQERAAVYRTQIGLYAEALAAIFRRPVRARWLVFLYPRQIIDPFH